MNEEFDSSDIESSRNDDKRNIKVPLFLTPEFAEFIGIMVGDGHLGFYRNKPGEMGFVHYLIEVDGNIKDKEYYQDYVGGLMLQLFNIKPKIYLRKRDNTISLVIKSKLIYKFLKKVTGIPQRKDNVAIPSCIVNGNREIKVSFLKGLADSDFTYTLKKKEGKLYPVVEGGSKSKYLIDGVSEILKELDINHCTFLERNYYKPRDKTYVGHKIYVNGVYNTTDWFTKVGFSNHRHLIRFSEFMKNHRK